MISVINVIFVILVERQLFFFIHVSREIDVTRDSDKAFSLNHDFRDFRIYVILVEMQALYREGLHRLAGLLRPFRAEWCTPEGAQ